MTVIKESSKQECIGPKEIFDRYYPGFHEKVITWLPNWQMAEDILSDVFENICYLNKTFPTYDDALKYLSKSIRNEWLNVLQRLTLERNNPGLPTPQPKSPEEIAILVEELRKTHELVKELSPQRGKVIQLYLAELSTKEIAAALNMTEQNVLNTKNNGKTQLIAELFRRGISIMVTILFR